MSMDKKKILKLLLDISIISITTVCVIFLIYHQKGIYPFGEGTIAIGDMIQQTIPESLYYIWDVLHGNASAFFSWNSGFGLNLTGANSTDAYLSPLNLFVLLSSRENLLNFVNYLLIIKMIFIEISMYFYLKKYSISSAERILGSLLYGFGAASLIHYNIMFIMDMAFLFPLLMIGYDKMLNKKKCTILIIVGAFCLIENVYMGAMVFLYLLLKSGTCLICMDKGRKEKEEYAFLMGISIGIAMLISAVVMFPSLYAISTTSRIDEFPGYTYLNAIYSSWAQGEWDSARYMFVNMTLPVTIGIYGFGVKKIGWRNYKEHIMLNIAMFIPMAVKGTELLWHGGTRMGWPVRFVFIMSFVLIDFSMNILQDLKYGTRSVERYFKRNWPWGLAIGLFVSRFLYLQFIKLPDINNFMEGICVLIFCACGIIYFLLLREKGNPIIIYACLLVEVSMMGYLFIAPNAYTENEYSVHLLRDVKIINDNIEGEQKPFERIKNVDDSIANANYSLVMGREALANFLHVINKEFQPTLRLWGYSTDYTRLLDAGGTIFSDTLFGIKYIFSTSQIQNGLYEMVSECDGSTGIHYYIYRNKYQMPFIVNLQDDSVQLSDNIFQNHNMIFKAVTGLEKCLIEEWFDIKIGEESTIINIDGRKAVYLYGNNQSFQVKVNGEYVIIPSIYSLCNTEYPTRFNDNLIYLGYFENQTIEVEFVNAQSADDIHLGLLDMGIFEEGVSAVNSSLQGLGIQRKNTGVKLNFNSNRNGYIFVPILYDEGWKCKVNRQKVKVENSCGFLKVKVEQGENRVRLKYVPTGMSMGGIISVIGLILYISYIFVYDRITDIKFLPHLYRFTYVGLMASFFVVVVFFYVIPIIIHLEGMFILK